jgi:hypothetical protein
MMLIPFAILGTVCLGAHQYLLVPETSFAHEAAISRDLPPSYYTLDFIHLLCSAVS